jgi:iron transport multicopper oxidase
MVYQPSTIPTYYQALSSGDAALDPATYGNTTNAYVLEKNEVVEITVYNGMSGRHSWHLHLHNFEIVSQSSARAGPPPTNLTDADLPQTPIRRDTVLVEAGGYVVIRFRADNPGGILQS